MVETINAKVIDTTNKEKYKVNSLEELREVYKKINSEVEEELLEFETSINSIMDKLNAMKGE